MERAQRSLYRAPAVPPPPDAGGFHSGAEGQYRSMFRTVECEPDASMLDSQGHLVPGPAAYWVRWGLDESPVSWPMLALMADFVMPTPKQVEEYYIVGGNGAGAKLTPATASSSVNFIRLPKGPWLRSSYNVALRSSDVILEFMCVMVEFLPVAITDADRPPSPAGGTSKAVHHA
ncbi:hypothetical protein DFJ74DRAFT_684630 [Hyaloraphidium curvatum]|nr:hypothetical protein DFJ74DRAFT_684630 [Hyaloraphidium curvatum]